MFLTVLSFVALFGRPTSLKLPHICLILQPSRSDRVYVHTPERQKESNNEEIQLVSVQKKENSDNQDGVDNGMKQQPDNSPEQEIKQEQEDEDDVLTSGDLMAFAWQVSQGMVSKLYFLFLFHGNN